ncbi:MAG: hypothetical protein EBT84_11460 [Sphingomonadaceae bacterium]|nr:hypothetical protein [Sphingomonadaceae bacterium]
MDPLGTVRLPGSRAYGPQTQRALDNFEVSGIPISQMPELIKCLAWVKKAATLTNVEVGEIAPDLGAHIIAACDEVAEGLWNHAFPVDVLQGGAGTSTNMNANEVIANRALELAGEMRGRYDLINPNDHVNKSQSTNDAYATAVRLAICLANEKLAVALLNLSNRFGTLAYNFCDVPKLGRTQLQDAVPMTLGQEFEAFAAAVREDVDRGL